MFKNGLVLALGLPKVGRFASNNLGDVLRSRITRGLKGTKLDTVPRNTGEISPLAH